VKRQTALAYSGTTICIAFSALMTASAVTGNGPLGFLPGYAPAKTVASQPQSIPAPASAQPSAALEVSPAGTIPPLAVSGVDLTAANVDSGISTPVAVAPVSDITHASAPAASKG
jgi:hypothetical protein